MRGECAARERRWRDERERKKVGGSSAHVQVPGAFKSGQHIEAPSTAVRRCGGERGADARRSTPRAGYDVCPEHTRRRCGLCALQGTRTHRRLATSRALSPRPRSTESRRSERLASWLHRESTPFLLCLMLRCVTDSDSSTACSSLRTSSTADSATNLKTNEN